MADATAVTKDFSIQSLTSIDYEKRTRDVSKFFDDARMAGHIFKLKDLFAAFDAFIIVGTRTKRIGLGYQKLTGESVASLSLDQKIAFVLKPLLEALVACLDVNRYAVSEVGQLEKLLSKSIETLLYHTDDASGLNEDTSRYFKILIDQLVAVHGAVGSVDSGISTYIKSTQSLKTACQSRAHREVNAMALNAFIEKGANTLDALIGTYNAVRQFSREKKDAAWLLNTVTATLIESLPLSPANAGKLSKALVGVIRIAGLKGSSDAVLIEITTQVQALLNKGARPEQVVSIEKDKYNSHHCDSDKRISAIAPATVFAAAVGNMDILSLLIDNLNSREKNIEIPSLGEDVFPEYRHGTPLTAALLMAIHCGHTHLVRSLYDAGARLCKPQDEDNSLPICNAFVYWSEEFERAKCRNRHRVGDFDYKRTPWRTLTNCGPIAEYPRVAMLSILLTFPGREENGRRLFNACLSYDIHFFEIADYMRVLGYNYLVPDHDLKRTQKLMYAYAFMGNKDKCLEFFNDFHHRSSKSERSVVIPNILAAMLYSGNVEAVEQLLVMPQFKAQVAAKSTICIPGDPGMHNLAELAGKLDSPDVLDQLLEADVAAKPEEKFNSVCPVESLIRGNTAASMHAYTSGQQASPIEKVSLRPSLQYSSGVQNVQAKHVLKRYLRSKGRPVGVKEWRSAWMWVKNAWMHIKACFGRNLTKLKVQAFEALANESITPERIDAVNDGVMKAYANSKSPIFTMNSANVWQPMRGYPERLVDKHERLWIKHTRHSKFSRLFKDHLHTYSGSPIHPREPDPAVSP